MNGNDARYISKIRDLFEKNADSQPASAEQLETWQRLTSQQEQFFSKLIGQVSSALSLQSDRRLEGIRNTFLAYTGFTAVIFVVVVIMGMYAAKTIAGLIASLCLRMRSLEKGDTDETVPFRSRKDNIGDMARSLESFRLAAIDKLAMERASDQQRQEEELARRAFQEKAEANANQRLTQARQALASGLKSLADCDLTLELIEPFAPQFESLREDIQSSSGHQIPVSQRSRTFGGTTRSPVFRAFLFSGVRSRLFAGSVWPMQGSSPVCRSE